MTAMTLAIWPWVPVALAVMGTIVLAYFLGIEVGSARVARHDTGSRDTGPTPGIDT